MKARPVNLAGRTYRIPTGIGTSFITINRNGGEEIFEVFVTVGKSGSDTMAMAEAIGRLISLIFRMGDETNVERANEIIENLRGIGGFRVGSHGEAFENRSLPDAVAKALYVETRDEISQWEVGDDFSNAD